MWQLMLPTIMGAASTVAGNAFSAKAQSDANKATAHEADINRQWETEMSNTAHQREIEDLKKSGLNPILSARYGGSSTPVGTSPQIQSVAKDFKSIGQDVAGVSTAVLNVESVKTQRSIQQVNEAQSAKLKAETLKTISEADISKVYADIRKSGFGKVLEGVDQTVSSARGVTSLVGDILKMLSGFGKPNEKEFKGFKFGN